MTRTKAIAILLVFVLAGAGYADWQVFVLGGQIASNQQSDTKALCSFRDDLQRRVDSGSRFLRAHPKGIPGIPVATIRVSIDNQQRTLTALKPLVCPTG